MQISKNLKQAERQLLNVSDAPHLDAERLLMQVLKLKESSWLYSHGEEELDQKSQEKFEKLVQERATGKPLAYILGEWEFYGRPFYVTPDVLVPRPETENLVAAALKIIKPGMTIADIGTGSGIIAITLTLDMRDRVTMLATDISEKSLEVAKKNAARHGVLDQIEFLQGDVLTPLKNCKIDLIVSNPPYIPTTEFDQFTPEGWKQGLKFEPRLALDGGPDGQKFVRQIQESGIPAIIETTGGKITSFPSSLLLS